MSVSAVQKSIIRRGAFDIGSGSTKLQCCDCEHELSKTNCSISRNLYGIEKPVQFGADLLRSTDGMLSNDIQELGIQVFRQLKEEGDRLGCTEYSAIATEVFRRAGNGHDYLDKIRSLGVAVSLLTQTMEAEMGFESVQAELKMLPMLDGVPRVAECVWDSGGLSNGQYYVLSLFNGSFMLCIHRCLLSNNENK